MEEKEICLTESNSKLSDYKFSHTIGTGTFGKVKIATNLTTHEKVAIKILEKARISEKDDLNRIEREMKYLKTLNHPNIIKVLDVIF